MAELLAQADRLCAEPRLQNLVQAQAGWPEQPGSRRVETRIHPADQMLLHSLRHHRDANAAVSQYFNVALQQFKSARQVLDLLWPDQAQPLAVLDFACGFGRLIRFLCCEPRPLQISVSEIQSDALAFVAGTFGVEALASSLVPEDFRPVKRFDMIWVASLFSHLPQHLFERWLDQLRGLLRPGGVLCFTVHGEQLVPAGMSLSPQGLLFLPQSENEDLDRAAYGTTYVSETFVRATVGAGIEPRTTLHRLPKALAHEQDLYVLSAHTGPDLSRLSAFRRGPWGWVDERRADGTSAVLLRGWAASIDDGVLPSVSIRIDDRVMSCPTGQSRPDVAQVFDDPRLARAGWRLSMPLVPGQQPWVEITAASTRGETALLYAGWPLGQAGTSSVEHVYQREIDPAQRSSLSVIAALVPVGSRVLDIGTGGGALGRHLSRVKGCTVDGITSSATEREVAGDGYRRIEVLNLEAAGWASNFADQRYDVIVCADVLEHLRAPEEVLTTCQGLLQPGGLLLASVPNAAYAGMVLELMHGDWRYGQEGLLDRTHLRFFTRRSFQRLLGECGWQVERCEPIDLTWYHSEFWTPLDTLPPAVARYLLAQVDASAYQIVFAARSDSAVAPTSLEAPVPAAAADAHFAVFASDIEIGIAGSGRRLRVARLGRVGLDDQTLHYILPAGSSLRGGLVWHPADRPGYLGLHAIVLSDETGQARWQWQAEGMPPGWLTSAPQVLAAAAVRGVQPLVIDGDHPSIRLPLEALGADPLVKPWQLTIRCGWPLSADYRALSGRALSPPAMDAADGDVQVVVPVFGGLHHVRRCLSSVISSPCEQAWHLTVVEDASPDAEVQEWLQSFANRHPQVDVIFRARNQGFVRNANDGMRLARGRDVILLNSDTEVAPGWIDRLRQAAYSARDVGTVTPFSNNATICSFPEFCEDNELPERYDVATLDCLFAQTHPGRVIEIPTAVGFCMFIRRDCLDDVGEFDARTFGAGYGEENDFCMRAQAKGWRHLHALDVFVFHAGGASFGEQRSALQTTALAALRRLHPTYEAVVQEFVSRDPARAYRDAVSRKLTAGRLAGK